MDKIIIKGAEFFCNIGVSERERKKRQKITVDAELLVDAGKAAETDDIKYSVNYSEVHAMIADTITKKKYSLIEALAGEIAKNLLKEFEIQEVVIRIKKPRALSEKKVTYAAVEITRKKYDN